MIRQKVRPRLLGLVASALTAWCASALVGVGGASAAQAPPGPPPGPPRPARTVAPIDLAGNWVSIVTEDWRFRMVTPPKGDYASVPLNAEARKVADAWDPAKDEASGNQCKAYGAAAIMRVQTRLRISWQDDDMLKIDTDAGTQTRLLHFGQSQPPAAETWQGHSVASWEFAGGRGAPGGGFGPPGASPDGRGAGDGPPQGGSLKVVTTRMKAGYLRKNGVPYSDSTTLTEYFDRFTEPNGDDWFVVTTVVEDPKYLQMPFITSTHFKKDPDPSKWNPTPCKTK